MGQVRAVAAKVWQRYRGLPLWAQILVGVVVLSVIVGPFLDAAEEREQDEEVVSEATTPPTGTVVNVSPCEGETPNTVDTGGTLQICQVDFDEPWPFSESTGLLSCRLVPPREPAVLFGPGDTAYAVNGTAQSRAEEFGWEPIDAIWLDNPASPGTKIDLNFIIELGLSLCPD